MAAAAVLLIGAAIALFRPSQDQPPAAQAETLKANNAGIVAAAVPEARQSSPVIENSKQQVVAREDARKSSPGIESPKPAVAAKAEVRRFSLVIESPKSGATVGMREELSGRIESEGWPVIFVQADIPGQPWWCQAPVTKVEGGRFSTKVVFGDEFTPPGTKFRIAGIVTRTRDEALKFDIGIKQQALPQGFPQSDEVIVTHR